jgi:hypothetical protein
VRRTEMQECEAPPHPRAASSHRPPQPKQQQRPAASAVAAAVIVAVQLAAAVRCICNMLVAGCAAPRPI